MPFRIPTLPSVLSALLAAFFSLAPIAPAEAGYEEGERAYRKGDYATAYSEWLAAANKGDARALYFLALMHQMEKGVERDHKKQIDFFMRAAEAGEPRAQFTVGAILALLEDPLNLTGVDESDYGSIGFSWIMRAGLKGVGPAYDALGEIYCKGIFVDKDPDLADAWYIIAELLDPYLRGIHRGKDVDAIHCGPGRDEDPIRAKRLNKRAVALFTAYDLPPPEDVLSGIPEWFYR